MLLLCNRKIKASRGWGTLPGQRPRFPETEWGRCCCLLPLPAPLYASRLRWWLPHQGGTTSFAFGVLLWCAGGGGEGGCAIFAKYEAHEADLVRCVHCFFATCLCSAREQLGQAVRAARCCGLLRKTSFILLVLLPWLLLSLQDDFSLAYEKKKRPKSPCEATLVCIPAAEALPPDWLLCLTPEGNTYWDGEFTLKIVLNQDNLWGFTRNPCTKKECYLSDGYFQNKVNCC